MLSLVPRIPSQVLAIREVAFSMTEYRLWATTSYILQRKLVRNRQSVGKTLFGNVLSQDDASKGKVLKEMLQNDF